MHKILLICFALSIGSYADMGEESSAKLDNNKEAAILHVSCLEVIVSPEKYDRQELVISGFIGWRDSGGEILYATRDSADAGLVENGVLLNCGQIKNKDTNELNNARSQYISVNVRGVLDGHTNITSSSTGITFKSVLPVFQAKSIFCSQASTQTNKAARATGQMVSAHALLLNPKAFRHKNLLVRGYLAEDDRGNCLLIATREASLFEQWEYFFMVQTNKCSNQKEFERARRRAATEIRSVVVEVRCEGSVRDLSGKMLPKLPILTLIKYVGE